MLSGGPIGVKNKSGHFAGGAKAGFGRKKFNSAISQATANSTAEELGKSFLYLTAVN